MSKWHPEARLAKTLVMLLFAAASINGLNRYNEDFHPRCILWIENLQIISQAHIAIAECEERFAKQGRKLSIVTQNIDELHHRAGSKNIYELHGKWQLG